MEAQWSPQWSLNGRYWVAKGSTMVVQGRQKHRSIWYTMLTTVRILRGDQWPTSVHPFCDHIQPPLSDLWATDFLGDICAIVLNMLQTSRRPWRPWRGLNVLCATLERPRQPSGLLCAFNDDLASFVVAQGRYKGRSCWGKGGFTILPKLAFELYLIWKYSNWNTNVFIVSCARSILSTTHTIKELRSKYMLETAYNAYSSTDVDVLKFQLVQYNQFYDGKNQQDSSECLLMLIEIINKGSVPYYGSHVSNSTGVSLSDILFSFMLEKYIVCNVCGLRSPSIESSGVLYISPTHTSSMQGLIMQGLQQKLEKSCFRCNKNTWHVESNHILQPPNYLIIVVNRFRYINNQFAKDKCSIPMDMTVVLGYHKFSLQATIDHHGPSIYSGHYTTSVNCCNRTFYCNDNKITEFHMINTKNSSTAYVVIYKLIT